jgi:MFS transporter, DHA2 family, glioxin efflux transporter
MGERAMIVLRVAKDHAVTSAVGFFFFGSYIAVIYYIPIYFQSIHGASAIDSGVWNLPFIIMVSVCTLIAGIGISRTLLPTAFLLVGAAMATIACGPFCTFDGDTSTGNWIGYQLLGGLGMALGCKFQ